MEEDPKQITEEMKAGLARMYADTSMREYLINAKRIANKNAMDMLSLGKVDEAKTFAVRLKVFEQLLEKGKSCFVQFERIKTNRIDKYANNKKG